MSLADALRFHFNVTALGNSALKVDRWLNERRMRKPGFWSHPHLAPPHVCSPRLKELIARHYLRGRHANRIGKVAWVTSGAPVEFLVALGYYLLYPENHAAICGIRRTAQDAAEVAEGEGYSGDLCSYARTDIGTLLSGKTPVGNLPRPDVLVCCTNICQTVLYWYRVLAHHFGVPLILVDTPFLYRDAEEHTVVFVQEQLQQAIEAAERAAGRSVDIKRFEEVMRASRAASELWMQVIQRGRHKPTPITAFEEFIHMAPIVEMRGEQFTVDYYEVLLAELDQRIKRGIGALTRERKRVIWDNLPIWHRLRWLGDLLAARGVALVASTYTNAWGELAALFDPEQPMESAARVYLHPILNRGAGHKLAVLRKLVDEFAADGVILHSDRSCKPYSIGQVSQRHALSEEVGVPALLLEADHNDPRAFAAGQAENRLDAFMEMMGV